MEFIIWLLQAVILFVIIFFGVSMPVREAAEKNRKGYIAMYVAISLLGLAALASTFFIAVPTSWGVLLMAVLGALVIGKADSKLWVKMSR